MIQVSHVTRRFGRFTAVDDVSFRLERGEVVGFLGPNGAGKTTILRMLSGFLPATRGSLSVAGLDVARDSLAVRRRIGYLPESVPLYREHRVEEMLRFQARLHGLPRREARARIGRVLERVGLGPRRRSLIGALSKGQRQRVGIAVALLPDPEVLLLDEPTSGLDPLQRIEVRGLIRELAERRTVLLSSHILPEVEAICPRVVILAGGRIAADGAGEALVAQLGSRAACRLEAALPAGSGAPGGPPLAQSPEQSVAQAVAALEALPAVEGVRVLEGSPGDAPADGYTRFELSSSEDVRCAVGRLAAERGWTLRELSWRRPTLEELFARLALGFDEGGRPEVPPATVATTREGEA